MSISCRQLNTTISRQICQGEFIQIFPRVYLKTVNTSKQRVFSTCWAPFFLAIRRVFLQKNGFIRRKIPRRWSYSRFQIDPRFTDCHTSAAALVRNDMQFTVVLRCSKNEKPALSYNSKKHKSTQDYHVLGTFYLELLARFELATRFPRNRGFVEALRPRIQILSAYADRADEAASFRMEDIKNDQGQRASVIFCVCSTL